MRRIDINALFSIPYFLDEVKQDKMRGYAYAYTHNTWHDIGISVKDKPKRNKNLCSACAYAFVMHVLTTD